MNRRTFLKLIGVTGILSPLWAITGKCVSGKKDAAIRTTGTIPIRVMRDIPLGSPLKPIIRYEVCVKNPACSGDMIKLKDYYFEHFSIDSFTNSPKEEKKMITKLLCHVRKEGFSLSDIVPLELPAGVDAKIIYV